MNRVFVLRPLQIIFVGTALVPMIASFPFLWETFLDERLALNSYLNISLALLPVLAVFWLLYPASIVKCDWLVIKMSRFALIVSYVLLIVARIAGYYIDLLLLYRVFELFVFGAVLSFVAFILALYDFIFRAAVNTERYKTAELVLVKSPETAKKHWIIRTIDGGYVTKEYTLSKEEARAWPFRTHELHVAALLIRYSGYVLSVKARQVL